jgi:hypothetical protein
MRDDWIFKAAIIAGLIAFVWRIATFPAPAQVNTANATRGQQIQRNFRQAFNNEDFIAAAVFATILQQDRYFNHGGWFAISDALANDPDPATSLQRWKDRALNAPESITQDDSRSAVTDEQIAWLQEFFNHTGGEFFVAYYLGVKLIGMEQPQISIASFNHAADGFVKFLAEQPEHATLWDRLYTARSYMRLEENTLAAGALRDLESFSNTKVTPKERLAFRDFFRSVGRTWINAGYLDEGVRVWKQINASFLQEANPVTVVEEWNRYGNSNLLQQEPELAPGLVTVIWDIYEQIESNDPRAQTTLFLDMLEAFIYRAESAGEDSIRQLAAARLRQAFNNTYFDPRANESLNRLARYEAILGNQQKMYQALEQALRLDQLDPHNLMARPAFNPYREEPRFKKIVSQAVKNLESSDTSDFN